VSLTIPVARTETEGCCVPIMMGVLTMCVDGNSCQTTGKAAQYNVCLGSK
jgi:hypothetical protein